MRVLSRNGGALPPRDELIPTHNMRGTSRKEEQGGPEKRRQMKGWIDVADFLPQHGDVLLTSMPRYS